MPRNIQVSSINEGFGPKYIFAVVAFFALGFGGMMVGPKLFAARPAAPPVAPPVAVAEPKPVAAAPAKPAPAPRPAQRAFSAVEIPLGGVETVQIDGTLAALAACRGALESGKGYDGVTLAGFAGLVGGKAEALTPAQIKQGCRLITEKDPAAVALRKKP